METGRRWIVTRPGCGLRPLPDLSRDGWPRSRHLGHVSSGFWCPVALVEIAVLKSLVLLELVSDLIGVLIVQNKAIILLSAWNFVSPSVGALSPLISHHRVNCVSVCLSFKRADLRVGGRPVMQVRGRPRTRHLPLAWRRAAWSTTREWFETGRLRPRSDTSFGSACHAQVRWAAPAVKP